MTSPTPPVSDVLRGIEGLAARSGEMLAEALSLIEQAARAESAAMETAVAALGEAHARTVVDLARMPVAADISRMLHAIRAAADEMLGGAAAAASPDSAPAHVSVPAPQFRSSPAYQPDASGRIDMYGISVPASRAGAAEEVISAARTAVAQNRKANPYDHYRGKNSWCKSLFLAAFARISAEAAQRVQAAAPSEDASAHAAPGADAGAHPREIRPAVPQRPSISGAGPLRAARPLADDPPRASTPAPRPSALPPSRLHAHGITAQTIEDPGQSWDPAPQAARVPARSFFKQRTR